METSVSQSDFGNIPAVLTVKELQQILRVSLNTTYGLIRSGKIHAKTVGRQLRITRSEVERYLST